MKIIRTKIFTIKTNKNNEMNLILRNINDEELSITLLNLSKKYELKCNLEEFQKNRFFKMFINVEEIMKELENKIEKSTFTEEINSIIMDIPIELTIINELSIKIEEKEKNKDEIINDLNEKNKELEKTVNELKNKLEEKEKIIKESEKLKKIKEEEESELNENENKLEKRINDLKKELEEKEKILKILSEKNKFRKMKEEEEKAEKEELKLEKSNLLVI